jgi:hypothetical protein
MHDIGLEERRELLPLRIARRFPIRPEHETRNYRNVESRDEEGAELTFTVGIGKPRRQDADRPGAKIADEARRILGSPGGTGHLRQRNAQQRQQHATSGSRYHDGLSVVCCCRRSPTKRPARPCRCPSRDRHRRHERYCMRRARSRRRPEGTMTEKRCKVAAHLKSSMVGGHYSNVKTAPIAK